MTEAEELAEEYILTKDLLAIQPDLVELIHQVAERTREEILKKTAWGMQEGGPGTVFVFCSDIRDARWEDEEVSR